mgnify:CR=1 FL=1
MDTPNPLAHGNRFQRAYYRWALPHYENIGRDDPVLRDAIARVLAPSKPSRPRCRPSPPAAKARCRAA